MKIGLREILLAGALSLLIGCEPLDEATDATDTPGNTDAGAGGAVTEPVLALGSGSGASFSRGVLTVDLPANQSLSAGGSLNVSVNVVNTAASNAVNTKPILVSFSSACELAGKASFSQKNVSLTGSATTTYTANGCVGQDSIIATYESIEASTSITVAPADVNTLQFDKAGFSASIAYRNHGMTGKPNNTPVSFKVLDVSGKPILGQTVTFELSSDNSDLGATLSLSQAKSNEEGLVTTVLTGGHLASTIWVKASHTASDNSIIVTHSQPVAVNTGLPDADSFSLHVNDAVVQYAGEKLSIATFTVYLADKHNNNVADGTVVQFWAEYGKIDATCVTVNSICSGVTWTSSGDRPSDYLTTITAYTSGVDTFYEPALNATKDGLFDVGNTRVVHSEVFFDRAFDGYTDGASGDEYIDHNKNGSFDAASATYRGVDCTAAARTAGHCAEDSAMIWGHVQLVYSVYQPKIHSILPAGPYAAGASFAVRVSDANDNRPPAGTTVGFEAIGDASATFKSDTVVYAVNSAGPQEIDFSVTLDEVETPGFYRVVVSFPGGLTATQIIQVQ